MGFSPLHLCMEKAWVFLNMIRCKDINTPGPRQTRCGNHRGAVPQCSHPHIVDFEKIAGPKQKVEKPTSLGNTYLGDMNAPPLRWEWPSSMFASCFVLSHREATITNSPAPPVSIVRTGTNGSNSLIGLARTSSARTLPPFLVRTPACAS